MELKITKERVLEAAGKCTDAKRILRTLFPEAFVTENIMKDGRFHGVAIFGSSTSSDNKAMIEIRGTGDYVNRAFWLNSQFDWKIEQQAGGITLIPTKKEEE